MKKKSILLFTTLLILFSACEDKESKAIEKAKLEEAKKVAQKLEKEASQPKTANDLLKTLGFDFNGEKVVIDLNKTNNFFENLNRRIESEAKTIEHKIESADINFTKGIGIEIKKDKIDIDLNKTRNMLQQLNILIKDIVLDINNSTY